MPLTFNLFFFIHRDAGVAYVAERFSRALQIAERSGREPLKFLVRPSEMATVENEERWLRNGNHCCSPSDLARLLLKVS